MTVDFNHFTPWDSLSGGLLIGLAAAILFLSTGRIAGVSGIFGKLVCDQAPDSGWRFAFLSGLVGSGVLWGFLGEPHSVLLQGFKRRGRGPPSR